MADSDTALSLEQISKDLKLRVTRISRVFLYPQRNTPLK
jgi:hypothetical protein